VDPGAVLEAGLFDGGAVRHTPDTGEVARMIERAVEPLIKRITELESRFVSGHDVAEKLVRCVYLYGGYDVNSRGPQGCILDALEAIAPDIAKQVREDGWDDVYRKHWSDTP